MAGEQNAVAGDRQFELQAGLKLRQGEERGWLTIDTIYERDTNKEYTRVSRVVEKISLFFSFFFYLEEIGLIQEGNRKSYLDREGYFVVIFRRYYIIQLIVEIISELMEIDSLL